MFVKQFDLGGDRNYGYLVADEESKKAFVIDPSYIPQEIVEFAKDKGFEIIYTFSTHSHHDHVDGNEEIAKLLGRDVLLYGDIEPTTGLKIDDGTKLPLGELELTIIHTPGHRDDHICLFIENAVFTGDTLFVGKIGGTWSDEDAKVQYNSLHNKLLKLPSSTIVYPGHNYGKKQTSTIEEEKTTNPFLIQPNFEKFLYLKKNWSQYKKEHNL